MLDKIDRETLTIEDLQEAGLNTSEYEYKDGDYWLPAGDSAKLIGWLNGCVVDTKYLSNPARRGDIKFRKVGAIRLYALSDLRIYVVKSHGPQPGFKHSQQTKDLISEKNKISQKRRWELKRDSHVWAHHPQ